MKASRATAVILSCTLAAGSVPALNAAFAAPASSDAAQTGASVAEVAQSDARASDATDENGTSGGTPEKAAGQSAAPEASAAASSAAGDAGARADEQPAAAAAATQSWTDGTCTVDYFEGDKTLYIYPTTGDTGALTDWQATQVNGKKPTYMNGLAPEWYYRDVVKMVIGKNQDGTKTGTVQLANGNFFFGSNPVLSDRNNSGKTPKYTARKDLSSIEGLENLDVSKVEMFYGMFRGTALTEIVIPESWNTANAKDMDGMFSGNRNLVRVDARNLDTGNVTDMTSMFAHGIFSDATQNGAVLQYDYAGGSLASVDVTGWDVSNVQKMYMMFDGTAKLKEIKGIENWDTSSVTRPDYMFQGTGMEALDLSKWDMSQAVDMMGMLRSASSLKTLNASSWDVSNVTTMQQMFGNCISLVDLDLSGWKTSKNASMYQMFNMALWGSVGDASLQRLDISGMSTQAGVTDLEKLFNNGDGTDPAQVANTKLAELVLGPAFKFSDAKGGKQAYLTAAPEGMYWLAVEGGTEAAPVGTKFAGVDELYAYQDKQTEKRTYTLAYPVTFDANGGAFADGAANTVQHVRSISGLTEAPADPAKAEFVFAGWFYDAEGTMPFDPTQRVQPGTTLYAGWTDAEVPPSPQPDPDGGSDVVDAPTTPSAAGASVQKPATFAKTSDASSAVAVAAGACAAGAAACAAAARRALRRR